MTSRLLIRLACLACMFAFTTCFTISDVSAQCWKKHLTVLPQTYPIWNMWNGVDPYKRDCLPRLGPTTCRGGMCVSLPATANVWVADESAVAPMISEAPMVPLVPAETVTEESIAPDTVSSPSDVVVDAPAPEAAAPAATDVEELKRQLEESMQRARAAEERAYAAEKSARAAQTEAEKRVSELQKKLEDADKE